MGLLLLISPPGYGKTTLMEYVANRLGLVFVKVNGPALGHEVTSLDPAEAPNATARQEVEKISFALEMGNNVLLYLDDIQHTSPELLQKFISLCDAQRQIEGVWDGRHEHVRPARQEVRGVMAGNPYTETGRARSGSRTCSPTAPTCRTSATCCPAARTLFALSYLENALTSNPMLAPLSAATVATSRCWCAWRAARTVRPTELSHRYSAVELEEILSVLRKLLRVQEVVLAINQAYIASAAQADAYRTEPPFMLQGCYRNMNKLAERIVPAMNDAELEPLIDDHYLGEAQTLTAGAEENLLKLAELRGSLTPEQATRWARGQSGLRPRPALGGARTTRWYVRWAR